MSLERMSDQGDRAVTSILESIPDVSSILAKTSRALDKNRVIHGANERYFDCLSGKTVGYVRKSLRDTFNIPGDASALIDGKEVGDDFVIQTSQTLEFKKFSGTKGASHYYLRQLSLGFFGLSGCFLVSILWW
jgi:hypothetical protein